MKWSEVYGKESNKSDISQEKEQLVKLREPDMVVEESEWVPVEEDDISYGSNGGLKCKMTLQKQENMTDKTTVLLEQRKSFTDIPAYEIVGLDRSDVTIVQEEVDKSNQYGGEPFRDGVYYVEVDSLTEIFDGYDGSFIVTGDTSFGEEMYGAGEHDYEIEIFNARST